MLSAMSDRKDKCRMISLICGILKTTITTTKAELINTETDWWLPEVRSAGAWAIWVKRSNFFVILIK